MKRCSFAVRGFVVVVAIIPTWLLASCDNKQPWETKGVKSESTISDQAVARLMKMTVAFGHMSVGYDIGNGLTALQTIDKRLASVLVREVKDPAEIAGPGIYHFRNGPNGRPLEKCENFRQALEKGKLGERLDVALFKFCYVDIQPETDVQRLFDAYVKTVEEVRLRFPRLVIVHLTTPLMTHTSGLKSRVKNFLKGDQGNIRRNRFNVMLMKKYGASEPIVDLAAVESTRPDGSRENFTWKGDEYNALWPGYTTDGGHLNDRGKRVAALEMVKVLTGLPVSMRE